MVDRDDIGSPKSVKVNGGLYDDLDEMDDRVVVAENKECNREQEC